MRHVNIESLRAAAQILDRKQWEEIIGWEESELDEMSGPIFTVPAGHYKTGRKVNNYVYQS